MASNSLSRREVSIGLVSLLPVVGFVAKTQPMSQGASAGEDGVSHTCECIHQEVVIKASRARVYQALTDAKEFGKVTEFVMPGSGASAAISPDAGGVFSLFNDHISGRHVEMIANERLVQAWREKSWAPGVYSVARFQLIDLGSSTQLVFDHAGFPQGAAAHLAPGWKSHYWEPLQKYFS